MISPLRTANSSSTDLTLALVSLTMLLCLASGPAAAKAGQRGQTLLSLPTMVVAFGAAISLLWAHAIYDTLKVCLP